MKFDRSPGRLFAIAVLAVSLTIQVAALLLDAAYWSAVGGADLDGQVLGFNQPLTKRHISLMVERFSMSWIQPDGSKVFSVCLVLFPMILSLLAMTQILGLVRPRIWLRPVVHQGCWFVPLVVTYLVRAWATGRPWTGESIIEGELSWVMVFSFWLLAWLPPGAWALVISARIPNRPPGNF